MPVAQTMAGQTSCFPFRVIDCLWEAVGKYWKRAASYRVRSAKKIYSCVRKIELLSRSKNALVNRNDWMRPLPEYREGCWKPPSMTLRYAMYQENSRSFQIVFAEPFSVKIDQQQRRYFRSKNLVEEIWFESSTPEKIEGQLKYTSSRILEFQAWAESTGWRFT